MNPNIKHFVDAQINNQGTYLVIKDQSAILIDASSAVNEAVTYAKENNIIIENMIITHGHLDHILGIDYLLLSFPNVVIYINQWDEDCLFVPNRNLSPKYGKDIRVEKPIKNLVALKGDSQLNLSDLLVNIIHIPGHTPGSQYVLIKEYNAVFIGDTIFKDKIGFHGKDLDYCNDKYFKQSLIEISKLDENLDVYPGHHEIFVLKDALKNNKILIDFLKS